jgi:hypothetical protein
MAKLTKAKLNEINARTTTVLVKGELVEIAAATLHEKQTWHEVKCSEGHVNYVSEPADGFKGHAEKAGQPFTFECNGCDGRKFVL